ncbi:MAG: hypothetical protein MNSN_02230 [Minisyncoccus archaeiphilus]|uniref:carboxypeptidase regulatory-like domain-containing protein n=1 Tax=Minisyncoccus archaeiphilus TaxID=3238481 RepID=UPI002B06714C|nr:MAG: hypothetical protein MNSN_02230 [Candidatus Parcubacteria bacterium]
MNKLFIKLLCISLLFTYFSFSNQVYAEMEVSGNITTNTTWLMANSPYIVTGTVQVLGGVTLAIEPGVIVKFDNGTSLNIGGELNAIGTTESHITFTSNQNSPQIKDWGQINFIKGSSPASFGENNSYLGGNALMYCDIEYGDGINSEESIYIYNTNLTNSDGINLSSANGSLILNNHIESIPGYGISLTDTDNAIVKHNTIINNKYGIGIGAHSNGNLFESNIINGNGPGSDRTTQAGTAINVRYSALNNIFLKNDISDNTSEYWSVIQFGEGNTFQNNKVTNNSAEYIIDVGKKSNMITYNNIYNNNGINIKTVYDHMEGSPSDYHIDVSHNYWGTTSKSIIDSQIWDYYDNLSVGKCIYEPFATNELDFTDKTSPVLSEIIPVPTPTSNNALNYTFNSSEAGIITYGGGCTSINTEAILGNNTVSFDVLADGNYTNCTIEVTDDMGNKSLPLNVTAFIVSTSYAISGTVKYYDGVKAVSSATVVLSDGEENQITTTLTDSDGEYSFTGLNNQNYVVRVEKVGGVSGVTAADQIKIGRHIVGLEYFNSIYKVIAADVNNSGSLTAADQIKIGRRIVGIDSDLISGSWKFYSFGATLNSSNYLTDGLSRTYSNLTVDMVDQDFVGIKMGDVNNSWIND